MKLACSICRHQWEANPPEGQLTIECPKCRSTVSVPHDQKLIAGSDAHESYAATSPSPSPPTYHPTMPNTPAPAPKPESRKVSPKEIDLSGKTIGGFRVLKMLGAGGMGAVCLAHQVSLDRKVALKILPSQMASNPGLLMRFTREALSAAQMTHHNIVQIYDIGNDQDIHYISMEYVRGETLTDVVKKQGRMKHAVAAGYILQAARGLQYAHDHGVIHRDIKPDNMMLNELGVIKIADMGLAKMRGASNSTDGIGIQLDTAGAARLEKARGDLTMSEVAMGTPAYMPPEQARDASTVDHRADQYSLGCTLYFLCAGRTPFTGTTALELITKHISEPLEPIEHLVHGFPRRLGAVIEKMMAKEPEERFANMTAVIEELEAFLGVEGKKGSASPRETDLKLLREEVQKYYSVPALKRRKPAIIGFLVVVLLGGIATAAMGNVSLAAGVFAIALFAPVAKFFFEGIAEKTFLYRRVRHLISLMSFRGWIFFGVAFLVLSLILGLGMFLAVGGAILAAVGYQMFIKRPVRAQRHEPIERVQLMLKELRVRGLSEEALQDFVAQYTSENWEELFEDLFGYEAMIQARAELAETEKGTPRKQHGTWRDPIVRFIERVEKRQKETSERKRLAALEAERLKAEGVTESEARHQAEQEASRIIRRGFLDSDISASVVAAQKTEKPSKEEREHKVIRGRTTRMFEIDQWIRMAAGLGLCALYGLYNSSIGSQFVPKFASLRDLDDPLGLIIGLLLIVSAFSVRTTLGMLILVGGGLIICRELVASALSGTPYIGDQGWLLGFGVILVVAGIAAPILYKLSGQKF